MVQAKNELFSSESQALANIFKALSHPARIDILKILSDSKSCYTGVLTEEVPLGRTTINQHLAELKKVGLIKGTISGTKVNYELNSTVVNVLKDYINNFIEDIEIRKEIKKENTVES